MFSVGRRDVAGGRYFAAVDGLRAVAVVIVMIFHLIPAALPGGFIGVDVFFVISGYVVTNSLLRQRDLTIGEFISGFYARRFRRIVPPLFLCLVCTIPVSLAVIPDSFISTSIPNTALNAFLGLSNFALLASKNGYFDTQANLNPFTHTWSLAVEEQFYIIFPLVLYGAVYGSQKRQVTASRGTFAALSIASFAYCAWATIAAPSIAYYMLTSRFWELSLGACGAMLGELRRKAIVHYVGHATLMNIGILLVIVSAGFANAKSFPVPWAIPACAGALGIIIASSARESHRSFGTALESPAFVAVGILSYSLYLWHWPVYTVMRWTVGLDTPLLYLIAVLLTVLLAWVSYVTIEYPTQNWRPISTLSPRATIVSGIGLMVAGFLVAQSMYEHPWRLRRTVVERNKVDWSPYDGGGDQKGRVCDVAESVDGNEWTVFSPRHCSSRTLPNPHIFVIGDSHAGAYKRMLRTVVSETGLGVTIASGPGCSEADFISPAGTGKSNCPSHAPYLDIALPRIKRGDIVFLASLRAVRLSNQSGRVSQGDVVRLTNSVLAQSNRQQAHREANDTISRLSAAGATVILDLPKPVFMVPPFRCSDWFNRRNPVCAPGLSVDRNYLAGLRRPVVASMIEAARQRPNVFLWDPFPILCPANPCSSARAGRPLFFDGDHLSGHGNDVLTPSFLILIRKVRLVSPRPS